MELTYDMFVYKENAGDDLQINSLSAFLDLEVFRRCNVHASSLAQFVLNFEKFRTKFVYFSVKNQLKIIDIYMNMRYTMLSTLKEVWQCIEK